MEYPVEQFSDDERRLLEPHFTNLDRPVFCVVDLPEVVKGALFARYSRYGGTLRRLYLDEFTGQGEKGERASASRPAGRRRAPLIPEPNGPRPSMNECSWSSATTRSPSWAGRISPVSGPRTC